MNPWRLYFSGEEVRCPGLCSVEQCYKCGRRGHDRRDRMCKHCGAIVPVGPCRNRLGTAVNGALISVRIVTQETRSVNVPLLEQKCSRCDNLVEVRQLMTAAQAAA